MASTANLRSIASILYGHLLRERPQKTQKYEAGTSPKSGIRLFDVNANKRITETRYGCRKNKSNQYKEFWDIQTPLMSSKVLQKSISRAKAIKKPKHLHVLSTRTLRKRKACTQQELSTKVSHSLSSKLPCTDKNRISCNSGEDNSVQLLECPRLTRSMLARYCSITQFKDVRNQVHQVASGIKTQRKKEAIQAGFRPKSLKNQKNMYSTNRRAASEGLRITQVKDHDTEPDQLFESCQTDLLEHNKACYFAQNAARELKSPLDDGKQTTRKAIVQQETSQNAPVLLSFLRSERGGQNKRSKGKPCGRQKIVKVTPSTDDSLKHEIHGKAGTVVWGKILKSRWWPGTIFDGLLAGEKPAKDGHAWIMWFGDHKITQMNVKRLELFSEKYIDRCSGNLPSLLQRAISQAITFCTKRTGIEMENSFGDSFTDTIKTFLDLVLKNSAYEDPSLPIDGEEVPAWFGNRLRALKEKKSQLLIENDERKCFSCQGYYTLVCKHPLFQKEICNECKESLQESLFAMDNDGSDMFCCICGFGYDSVMYVCSSESCKRSFCTNCLTSYIKEELCQKIQKQKKWLCFLCTPYKKETHGSIIPEINHKQSALHFYKPAKFPSEQSLENNARFWPEKLRVLSVCDGVGTVKQILDDLGIDIDTYYSAETDADSLAVLSHRHGAVVNQLGDMRTVTRVMMKSLLPIDLMVCCPPDPNLIENSEIDEGTDKVSSILKFAVMVKDLEVIAKGRPMATGDNPSSPCNFAKSLDQHILCRFSYVVVCFCFNTLPDDKLLYWSKFKAFGDDKINVEPCLLSCEFIEECPYIKCRLCWSNIPEIYVEAANQTITNEKKSGIKLDWGSIISCDTECQKADNGGRDDCLKVDLKKLNKSNGTNGKATNEKTKHVNTNQRNKAKMVHASRFTNADIGSQVDEIERCMGYPAGYTKDVGLTSQQRAVLLKEAPCPRMLKVLLQPIAKYFKPCHDK